MLKLGKFQVIWDEVDTLLNTNILKYTVPSSYDLFFICSTHTECLAHGKCWKKYCWMNRRRGRIKEEVTSSELQKLIHFHIHAPQQKQGADIKAHLPVTLQFEDMSYSYSFTVATQHFFGGEGRLAWPLQRNHDITGSHIFKGTLWSLDTNNLFVSKGSPTCIGGHWV